MVRDLKVRYVGSLMGFFWSVIHPLVLLVSYSFVFSVIFQVRPHIASTENFAVFLFCGILPWLYFQDTVLRSCRSVTDHANLLRKTLFPSEILPITVLLSNLVTHLVGLAILLAALLYLGLLGWTVLLLPLYLVPLMVLSLGLGWLAAALQVFLRDTAQVLTVLLIFWFWFTPIFYPVEMVPEPYRFWIDLNPVGPAVDGYRRLLLENRGPDAASLLWLTGWALASFAAGGWVFRHTKREFVDVL